MKNRTRNIKSRTKISLKDKGPHNPRKEFQHSYNATWECTQRRTLLITTNFKQYWTRNSSRNSRRGAYCSATNAVTQTFVLLYIFRKNNASRPCSIQITKTNEIFFLQPARFVVIWGHQVVLHFSNYQPANGWFIKTTKLVDKYNENITLLWYAVAHHFILIICCIIILFSFSYVSSYDNWNIKKYMFRS